MPGTRSIATSQHPKVVIEPHIIAPLRDICLALPEADEAEPFGSPSFRVNAKHFAMTHRDAADRPTVWVKAARGRQEALTGAWPDRYFRPPYLGGRGWIGCWLDDPGVLDWDDIEDLVLDSYRLIAPKRLVRLLDTSDGR